MPVLSKRLRQMVVLSAVALLGGCYPNPNDFRSGGGNPSGSGGDPSGTATGGAPAATGGQTAASGGGTVPATGGRSASGGATGTGGVTGSGGRPGTGGAASGGRAGTGGAAGAAGGSGACTNPMFPVSCPALNGAPASCWAPETDCSTLKNCDGTPHACRAMFPHYVCSIGACVSDTITNGAKAYCDAMNRCAPQYLIGLYGTVQACYTAQEANWTMLGALPDTGWTTAAYNACAAAITALSCPAYFDQWPAACAPVGKRANGNACASDDQCASVRCVYAAGASCGTCGVRLPAGSACTYDSDCAAGLTCTDSGVCVAPLGAGAACNKASAPCINSLSCRSGVCATPGRTGATCATHDECDVPAGWLCNGTTLKCGGGTGGATCGPNADGTTRYCSAYGFCSSTGSCTPAAKEGQACNTTTGPLCALPGQCSGGTCTVTKYPPVDCPVAATAAFSEAKPVRTPGAAALRPAREWLTAPYQTRETR